MEEAFEQVKQINIQKTITAVFIIVGFINILGDIVLIDAIKKGGNNTAAREKAFQLFLIGFLLALVTYIIVVSRNYNFYIIKKNAGLDASPELQRLFGSILILIGFIIIFNEYLENGFNDIVPPVF